MFFGKTDWEHADDLATRSREGCFFCPEKVFDVTPKYPEEVVEGGRIRRGRALVFPNLFPLAAMHAVVTYPERHFLRPSEFTPDLLEEGLGAAVDFAGRAERAYPATEHLEVCCNHMLPAGASMVHPHFQVFGGEAVPALVQRAWDRSAAFAERHGASYWRTLVDEEKASGERFVGERAGCAWLVPYAPHRQPRGHGRRAGRRPRLGARRRAGGGARRRPLEGAGVVRTRRSVGVQLHAVRWARGRRPIEGAAAEHPVVLRVIARSAFKPDYRTDDYFLQKQLGGELIFETPEAIAATLRGEFSAT